MRTLSFVVLLLFASFSVLSQQSAPDNAPAGELHPEPARKYTKDSLQILLVKLDSIQALDERSLLERDIRENADYYLDLLDKLKESDLPPATYAYLENRIRSTHQQLLQRKYYTSLAFNGLGILAIAGLLYLVFQLRKRKDPAPEVALSNQEEKVRALILDGKTNKEIAGELFISISTVKTHISNIYSKLKVSTRQELRLRS